MTGSRRLPELVGRLPKTRAALEYAQRQHAGQRRTSDGAAFITHPLDVGWLLYAAGLSDEVIAAGVLHDVLEKTVVTASELRRRFGAPVAALVEALTEDQTISGYAARKAALRQQVAAAGAEALLVFAADKVAKIAELRAVIARASRRGMRIDESLVPPRRLTHLRRCLGTLEDRLGDVPLVRQLRIELIALGRELDSYRRAPAAA